MKIKIATGRRSMKCSVLAPETVTTRKPVWLDIAGRFPDDRECLAAFLAFETAEILEGVKPASLVNLVNRERCCGKNFYALWKDLGTGIISQSSLQGLVLTDRGDSLLLMLYHRYDLERLLANRGVASVLRKAGYPAPFTEASVLGELQRRMSAGNFPHEIGTLLGYPVKDVAGYLGWGKLPCTGTVPWKMFGDPSASLALAEAFRRSRSSMAVRLLADTKPIECLRSCAMSAEALAEAEFSTTCNENDNQYYKEAV
jgi:hypothetical protein